MANVTNYRLSSAPEWGNYGDIVKLDANAVAGTAEDLRTELVANGMTNKPVGLLISATGGDLFLRTATLTAAGTGKGIKVASGQSLYIPYPDDVALLYESATEAHVAVFY
jgi:hypothetical protein